MKVRFSKPLLAQLAACGVLMASLGPVLAQTAPLADAQTAGTSDKDKDKDTESLSAVVITGQKRKETIQSVPLSVSVVPSQQLERQDVVDIADLSKVSASLEFGAPGVYPGGGAMMRGLGTQVLSQSGTPSVGFVLDGVAQGNINSNMLFDVNRVEVLKGPQGTLFGASVSSGVVNIVSNAPDLSDTYYNFQTEIAPKGLSEYGHTLVGGAFNMPLTNQSAIRLAVQHDDTTGVERNTLLGEDSDKKRDAARLRYLNKLSSNVTLNLEGDYERQRVNNGEFMTINTLLPGGAAFAPLYAACGVTPSGSNRETCTNVPVETENRDISGATAQLDWALGSHTLTSITSYRKSSIDSTGDIFGLPSSDGVWIRPGVIGDPIRTSRHQFTEELRLSSQSGGDLEYVTGLYYVKYGANRVQPQYTQLFVPGPGIIDTQDTRTYLTDSNEVAAFGQGTLKLTATSRLTLGGRLTRSGITSTMSEAPNLLISPAFTTKTVSDSRDNFSYKLGIQQDLNQDAMVFTSISRGYKAGVAADASPATLAIVRPELPTNIEAGLKGSWLNNRLATNITVFHTELKDFQGQTCSSTIPPICVTNNIPKVVSQGVEVDIFGRPMRGLDLNYSLAYNPVKYPDGYIGSDGTNIGGTQMTGTTKIKSTISGEYGRKVTDTLSGFLGGDATYRSETSLYPTANQLLTYPSHWTVGGQFGIQNPQQGWKITIFGRNLTKERMPTTMFPLGNMMITQWLTESALKSVGIKFEIAN